MKPFEFFNDAAAYQAEFLIFSQHVQYLKIKGPAFIGNLLNKSNMCNYSYIAFTFFWFGFFQAEFVC